MAEPPIERTNFYVLTGCSGGGKSTLLAALAHRGIVGVEESGRAIVRAQERIGSAALPWKDGRAFAELILSQNVLNFERLQGETRPVFFDRGIPEAIGGDHLRGDVPLPHHVQAAELYRYNRRVFVVPPWPEIYTQDAERRHGFAEGVREYEIQGRVYEECGYELVEVPRMAVEARAEFVLARIATAG